MKRYVLAVSLLATVTTALASVNAMLLAAQDKTRGDAVADPALRRRLAVASEEDKRHMQEELVAERRSSHMWLIVHRPGAGGN